MSSYRSNRIRDLLRDLTTDSLETIAEQMLDLMDERDALLSDIDVLKKEIAHLESAA